MISTPTTAREYLRVSADRSGRMKSVTDQHGENERIAEAEGWVIGEPYTENGAVSASRYSRKTRPGFGELVADLEAGRFGGNVLMLWEPSRGSRRLSEWARFLELLEERRVLLHVTSHGRTYDLTRPRDRRSLQEDGTDAEYESGKISERVGRAMAANAAEGRPHGRPPYGYRREYELTATGRRVLKGQVPDEPAASVVRRIFAEVAGGHSLRSVAARLNADRVPPPKAEQWSAQTVRDLCLTATYAGLRCHVQGRRSGHDRTRDGTLTPGTWEPLVTPEVWHTVRALLTDPARRVARPGRDKHLLSMIATCGVCGGPLAVRYRRDEAQYWCHRSGHVRGPKADLDDLVERLILARLARPGAYRELASRDTSAELQAARDELATVRADHRDSVRLFSRREISPAAFAAAEPQMLADIALAEERVRDLEQPPALRLLLGEPGEDVADRWEAAPIYARREAVRILFGRIELHRSPSPGHRLTVHERVVIDWAM